MHPGQQEDDQQHHEQRQAENLPVRHLPRPARAGHHQQRARAKRQRQAEVAVGVHVQPRRLHQAEEARRVVIEARVQPGLRGVNAQDIRQALAAQQRREHHAKQRQQEDQRVAHLQLPARPQHDDDGQEERALQLERQRQREARCRRAGPPIKRQRKAPQRARRVQAVALGEHAAVQDDRGQQQHRAKRQQTVSLAGQLRGRARKKSVADEGDRLHRVQRGHAQSRDDKENVLVEHVVLAHVRAHALRERTCGQPLDPIGQVDVVVAG